jgi:predicted phosphodiesterase
MSGRKYRFGVVSCTHLGSKYQQLTHLYTFYKYCKRKGVDTVLHCGDLIDGEKIYRGMEYELHTHGATAQKQYCVDNYPHVTGIKTLVIMGNHDESFYKTSGYNVVEAICAERDDMEYIGDYLAYINLDTIRVAIMHSDGGVAYARSYKVQKIIEQLSPEAKPHLMFVGHWHVNAMIPAYRNVEGVSIGAFQSQTPYLVRKGLMPNVSGLVVEVEVNDKGLVGVKYDWRHFYEMKKNDY